MNTAPNTHLPPDKWFRDDGKPLVYLEGRNGDWQDKAIELLRKDNADLNIACYRPTKPIETETDFLINTDWETSHMRLASHRGGILFWLDGGNNKVASKRLFHLGEWLTHWKYRQIHNPEAKLNLAVGVADDFIHRKYIIQRILEECKGFIIATTLEETCSLMTDYLK
jgi:hypothetical protein